MLWRLRKTNPPPNTTTLLEDSRVVLRPPAPGDWREWAQVRARNRDHLRPYEPIWPEGCLSRDFFQRRLARQERERRAGIGYSFLILRRDDARLIGGINLNHVCRGAAQYASLGYWIDASHQGSCLMSEALGLLIRHARDDLRLHRLNAATLPHNTRSINLLRRAGFTEEGFAASYMQIDGAWQDHILFGLVL